jgi:drug/metabolite transporter (DMT)-like permease
VRVTLGIALGRRADLVGAVWMIAAMAVFAIEDALIKVAAQTLPVGQILILLGLGGVAAFGGVARLSGQRLFPAEVLSRAMRVRAAFEIIGRLFYALAISMIPLSAATVILQATPLVVVAGAAVIFGETVGWRRWTAILIGLSGVLVIVRPGAEGVSALLLLAVIGMIGFAGRDLASRAAPAGLSTAILGLYGFASIVVAGAALSVWQGAAFVAPDGEVAACLLGAVLAGVAAYACLMKAMRTGDVSAVTPFRYTRLLFGIGLGVAVFEERVTGAMMLGSALIVVSGLFIAWRGKQATAPR